MTAAPPVPPVLTERLELVSMSPELIAALLCDDREGVRREIGLDLPDGFVGDQEFVLRMRLDQMREDRTVQPWLLRLIVTRQAPRQVVGRVGFHEPPDEDGQVEIGYSVLPPHRGRGFATEAGLALIGWAHAEHGITRFRAAVSPTNGPSLAVMRKLGFRRTGLQWDDRDGEELVFEHER